MKSILLLILTLSFWGCSFKKDQTGPAQIPEIEILLQSIKHDTTEEAIKNINSFTIERIVLQNAEEQLLTTALVRGNPSIVSYLLKSGVSPYRNNSRTYLPNKMYDSPSYERLKEYNFKSIAEIERSLIDKKYSQLNLSMKKAGINCETLVNLHSQFNLIELRNVFTAEMKVDLQKTNEKQEYLIEFLSKSEDCKHLKTSRFKNDWVKDELIRNSYYTEGYKYPSMFNFLVSLFDKPTFSFSDNNIDMEEDIDPSYLMRARIVGLSINEQERELLKNNWLLPLEKISSNPNYLVRSEKWPFYNPIKSLKIIAQKDFERDFQSKYYRLDEYGAPIYLSNRISLFAPWGGFNW